MKELLLIAAAVAVAMGAVAVSIGPGHDTAVLVSPPGAVVEEFVRKLATDRSDRAAGHLDNGAGRVPMVAAQGNALRGRAGEVDRVLEWMPIPFSRGGPARVAQQLAVRSAPRV